MPTITIKTTSPFFSHTDVGAPSALDIIVSGSSNANLPNGTYDGWCLNPFARIEIGTAYGSDYYNGVDLSAYTTVGLNSITTGQINQINWMLAQDFTADPKYGGQFNFGEVQAAIWDILGYKGYLPKANDYLTNKGVLSLNQADIDLLKSMAADAQASGESILPAGSFFTIVIDPAGDIQPIIAQLRSAKLGNYVWEDIDSDGIQESDESGVNGVTVNLLDANGNIIATTTTGDDLSTAQVEKGFYEFTGLNAGQYRVHFVKPADFVAFTNANANNNTQDAVDSDADISGRSQLVTLSKGGIDMTLDAGLIRGASLGDRVWLDKNGDGRQDAGEDGVSGVKVLLCDALGNPTGKVATTNSSGNYLFNGLLPGTYSVKFELPSGYEFTRKDNGADASDSDADQATGKTGAYTLTSGESNLTVDAGVLQRAHLGDRIWEDSNANGQQDAGEVGIGLVKVYLKDANGQIIASTTTDANGIYGFDVLPGTYSIQIETPAGYQVSPKDVGSDTIDSDIDAATLMSQQVSLQSGETNVSVDGGLFKLASLGDRVWLDKDGDGQQDAGEDGVSGIKVLLCDALGDATGRSATTDAIGNYLFTDLVPGTYSVKFELPSGYEFTRQDQGADASDSDANLATGKTDNYTLASGEINLTADAGLVQRAHLGDRIWEDTDANGQQDVGEVGIGLVKVYLKDANGQIIASTTTDANGIYGFDVLPGTYSIQIEKPAGYQVTQKDVGSDTSDSDIDAATLMSQQVALQSGETNLSVDGGLYKLASLGDRVWLDKDGDGQQDVSEDGVSGAKVLLCDALGNPTGQVATTNSNGNYLFIGLVPGTYSVKFELPAGYEFTRKDQGADASDSDADQTTGKTGTYTLASGESNLTADAGVLQRAHLGDRIWEDKNANGQQDASETGIGSVKVYLKDANGQIIASTTTDANGIYGFDVLPGTYSIQIEKPAGYQVSPKDVGSDKSDSDIHAVTLMSQQVTLQSGDTNLSVDGGLYKLAEIGDRVWHDRNGNGRQDADEEGLGNVTVRLKDAQGAVISTQTTDAQGNYLFTGLRPGTYSLGFIAPDGYEFTKQNVGDDLRDSDTYQATGLTAQTNLTSGESDLSWDAGLVRRAHLGDRIWEDKNANGQQDAGESGIGSVKVYLKDANGQIIASTTTDANGIYGFDVLPGTYSIQIEKPAGYQVSPKDRGADTSDSDIDTTTLMSQQVTLTSGETNLIVDGGLYRLAQIGDRVWHDRNGNGRQDAGEEGIGNVTVQLRDSQGVVIGTQTTDAQGNYLFTGLRPATYSLGFVAPTGYEFTIRNVGDDAEDSDPSRSTGITSLTTLVSGESDLRWDAGLVRRAHLGDRIWEDKNANGQQDTGEVGIASVKVYLKDVNGQIIASTTTDASGIYGFDALPGTYSIQIEKPTGYQVSPKDVGSDTSDSDIDAASLMSQQVTLQPGETNLSVDGGLYKLAEIGDRVWHDRNGNGRQDAGEEGLGNVTVQLKDAQGMVISTQTTDQLGNYLFTGLRPGTYSLGFIAPSGYVLTNQNIGDDAGDSDANRITGATAQTELSSGESDRTWDAGLYRKASIGDYVWVDRDHDSIQDADEHGAVNIKVNLQDTNGTTLATTLTDQYGHYLFSNLDPGTYRLVFDRSNSIYKTNGPMWHWAKMDVGNNDAIDADAYSTTDVAVTQYTTLESGENDMTWDAGVTPLIIDLNGDGVHTVARADAKGTFDLLGTGHAIASGWASAQDGMLAVDINGNGRIDNIHELFGGLHKGDAFAKLATYDSNGDGQVDAKDEHFASLRIWRDANGNHTTDAGELMSLQEAGVASLKARFVELPFVDAHGNLHLERSNAVLSDGTTVDMTDVYFNVAKGDAAAAGVQLTSLAGLLGDDRSLDNLLAGPNASQKAGAAQTTSTPDVIDSHFETSRTILSQLDRHDSPSGM